MAFTHYLEQKLLDHALGTEAFTMPEQVYVALSSTAPNQAGGNVTEPTFTGYARQAADFAAASGGNPSTAANSNVLAFGDPDSDGGASHFAIFDAATGGNALIVGALSAPITWQGAAQNPISFEVGDLVIGLQ